MPSFRPLFWVQVCFFPQPPAKSCSPNNIFRIFPSLLSRHLVERCNACLGIFYFISIIVQSIECCAVVLSYRLVYDRIDNKRN